MTDYAGPQRLQALERANAVRAARADTKRRLHDGELTFVALLDQMPECCAKLPAFEVLTWCPKVGPKRARQLAQGVISETLAFRYVRGRAREKLLEKLQTGGVL